MEKPKNTYVQDERPINDVKHDWGGCHFWILGNDDSARNDLKSKFEIKEEIKERK